MTSKNSAASFSRWADATTRPGSLFLREIGDVPASGAEIDVESMGFGSARSTVVDGGGRNPLGIRTRVVIELGGSDGVGATWLFASASGMTIGRGDCFTVSVSDTRSSGTALSTGIATGARVFVDTTCFGDADVEAAGIVDSAVGKPGIVASAVGKRGTPATGARTASIGRLSRGTNLTLISRSAFLC
jgi:hypothetical protein